MVEIRADYKQQFLLPPAIEDWIGDDHPARFIGDFVDSLDLRELTFKVRLVEQGRPSYGADLLLKVWLYGFMENIRSSRKLEKACRNQMGFLWLTGCNYPDHNTLWRFFRDNREALGKVFKKSVKVAQGAGMVGLRLHAVDGTKILSVCSPRHGVHREGVQQELFDLDIEIEAMMSEVEKREGEEQGEYRLPEKLQDAKERRRVIAEALQEMEKAERDHLNLAESEARMMRIEKGRNRWAYNGQTVVDESGLIVAEAVTNQEMDGGLLVPMLDEAKENLGEVAEETVADAGYRGAETLGRAEEKGYEVLIAGHSQDVPKGNLFHVTQFTYDESRDCCVCPAGKDLEYVGKDKERDSRIYYCQDSDDCPLRSQCTRAKRGRKIKISSHHRALIRQREKRQDPEKQKALGRRKVIVEPVFGWIKHNMGFRRWTVKGLDNVRAQWSLLCTTVNLKKLLGHWQEGRIAFS